MDKKQFLLQFFEKLLPHWPMLEGFLPLLQEPTTTDEEIEGIFDLIKQYISTLTDGKQKEVFGKLLEKIEDLHRQEEIHHEKDLQEAEELLSLL